MDASTSTHDLTVAEQGGQPPAADGAAQEVIVHMHLDLDTDAGMAQARALLSGIFRTIEVQGVLPAQEAQATLPAPAREAQAVLPAPAPEVQAALVVPAVAAAAAPPPPQLPMPEPQPLQAAVNFLQQPQQANLLQQLIQNTTPTGRRRPGRPSRADQDLRTLLAAVQPQPLQQMMAQQPQAQVQARMPCHLCNQPRADSIIRSCGHLVCRACVLPFIQLRPVCPVTGCSRPTTLNDIIHFQ